MGLGSGILLYPCKYENVRAAFFFSVKPSLKMQRCPLLLTNFYLLAYDLNSIADNLSNGTGRNQFRFAKNSNAILR